MRVAGTTLNILAVRVVFLLARVEQTGGRLFVQVVFAHAKGLTTKAALGLNDTAGKTALAVGGLVGKTAKALSFAVGRGAAGARAHRVAKHVVCLELTGLGDIVALKAIRGVAVFVGFAIDHGGLALVTVKADQLIAGHGGEADGE